MDMVRTTKKSYLLSGMLDSTPFVLIAGPFGILFGVFATEAGLQLYETIKQLHLSFL